MRIEFQNTLDDFRQAVKAHRRWRWNRKAVGGLIGWILFVVLALLLYTLEKRNSPGAGNASQTQAPAMPLAVWVPIFLVIWAFVYFGIRRQRYQRAWAGQPNEHVQKRWDVSDAGIVIDTGHSRSDLKWSTFRRYLEQPTLFMLYVSEFSFHMVPKRAFANDVQLAEFRDLLRQHIQPRTQCFPVIQPEEKPWPPL
jgi:hypothetical protein